MEKRGLSYTVMEHRYTGRTQEGEMSAGSVDTARFEKSTTRIRDNEDDVGGADNVHSKVR